MLKYNGEIVISVGKNRRTTRWNTRKIKLSEFLNRLSRTTRTHETLDEFSKMEKALASDIKDVGGFVGGILNEGKRKSGHVLNRSIVTLDADYADSDFWDRIELFIDYFVILYSTHKHRCGKERYRVIIPLSRQVSEEEYEPLGRKIAESIGIDYFDNTTYEASRLMYWPSTSLDGEYVFKFQDEKWLNPDDILGEYKDWKDSSKWPRGKNENKRIDDLRKKQEDPLLKKGVIGAFCRAYSVEGAIEKFLGHVYEKSSDSSRYTYKEGTSSGGLVIYENGKFAYSYHSTDKACGVLCNAFDLVKIHLFGGGKEKGGKSKSFFKMIDFAKKDEEVRKIIGEERLIKIKGENSLDEEIDWIGKLEINKDGGYKATIENILLILENDSELRGKIGLNEFSHRTFIRGDVPWKKLRNSEGDGWRDSDDSAFRHYVEKVYGIACPNKVYDAIAVIEEKNRYHPICDYLNSLNWDGVKRVDTFFIDYLGVEDTIYSRQVTRKALVAAVGRVFSPGIKFDYMPVIVGKQGIGKSHILSLLGQNWYSDSLNTVLGKEAYEQLQEGWIIEMAELSAIKRAETEAIKHFISKREDIYRVAYGRRVSRFQRQCIFFGTTNEKDFLRDKTGNRRFWPLITGKIEKKKNIWRDLNKYEIDQVWAEARELWEMGENLFLEDEASREAEIKQEAHTEEDGKEGMIAKYLDIKLPENWSELDIGSRRNFIHGTDARKREEGKIIRGKVCAMEIWVELFLGDLKLLSQRQAREINQILRKIDGWDPYDTGTGKLSFGKIYGNQRAFKNNRVQSCP